ncbi:MAG: hypothetical protein JOY64_21360 [Alphaproteobacteria bacterium]|nr:hypothetical protein [Alphaproteobacteria bacterium]
MKAIRLFAKDRVHALKNVALVAACVSLMASCASGSYDVAALQASDAGDQKTAISLAKKEVARFSDPDQCSRTTNHNCGTLALAYGSLAEYQILDGDRVAGEGSFRSAKGALSLTDPKIRSSATAIVYRDVSEAFWKVGDRDRAIAVFKEGRAAGADQYLYMSAAAQAVDQQPTIGNGQAPSRPPVRPATK